MAVDASKAGPKIDRNIFGQFAEHLGYGVYEGIWVGPGSPIPNTRGIRNDVVAALKAIKVPNVRWPGGCFADEYHWRKGIGRELLQRLCPAAKAAGYRALYGHILGANREMLDLAARLGFRQDSLSGDAVTVVRPL